MVAVADNLCIMGPFFIEFEQSYLHGDLLPGESGDVLPHILFLHGGEPDADRRQFFLLRQMLFMQYGLSSCAFDFIGHGSTGGDRRESSLQQRTQQASDIVDACFDGQPFSIAAVGMGAYTALKLLEQANVRHLVFLAPKLYCRTLYTLPLSDVESKSLDSCFCGAERTDVLTTMQGFHRNLCLVAAEQETQASCVIDLLQQFAVNAVQCQRLNIPSKASMIVECINDDALMLRVLVDSIAATCQVS